MNALSRRRFLGATGAAAALPLVGPLLGSNAAHAQTAKLLIGANSAYRTQTNELLLAALEQSLGVWSGGKVLIDVEGHGRTGLFGEIDLSRRPLRTEIAALRETTHGASRAVATSRSRACSIGTIRAKADGSPPTT